MVSELFTQTIDTAFEEAVGERGASRARFAVLRDQLNAKVGGILHAPVREAVPLFALPARSDDLAEIEVVAHRIADEFDTLLVVGMGGSSLGGETLEYLRAPGAFKLHFVDTIDPVRIAAIMESLSWKTTAFLVVSKSGNTLETLALLSIFLREAKARLPNYTSHFHVITQPNDNPLHRLVVERGIHLIAHDEDLGGRFSIFSAVGLIPAAVVGVDIRAIRSGAQRILRNSSGTGVSDAVDAAALHVALMDKQVNINVTSYYSDRLSGLARWYRQCWSESLGKDGKGTIPVSSRGATDQHSQLQLYLDGPKDKFFTSLIIDTSSQGAALDAMESSDSRIAHLNYRTLGDLSMAEQRATNATLVASGAPLRSITLGVINETVVGGLLMHYMLEVIFTAELLGVYPFDQPAVEAGKRLTLEYLLKK